MDRLLNFRNQSLEQEFVGKHDLSLNKSERLLHIILFCYAITYTGRYIFDYFLTPGYTLITMVTAMAIIFGSIAAYCCGKCLFKKYRLKTSAADVTVLFVSILALVLLNNPIRSPKDNCEASYVCFWDCYEIGIFNIIMVQFLRRWYHKAFYYYFNCIYFLIWKQATIYDHLMAIKIVGFMIMTTCLFYFNEKGMRINFLEKYRQDVSTKHILKALPEGILIIDDTLTTHHYNSSLEKLFPDINPHDKSSIEAFTKSILYPKPRNLFMDFKMATIYDKIFLTQDNGRSGRATNMNSMLSEEGYTQTNNGNTQPIDPECGNSYRPLFRNKSIGKKEKGVRPRLDSQDASNSPVGDRDNREIQPLTNLYSYLQAFFKAQKEMKKEIKVNFEETLEHFYFDAKYEGKSLDITISSLNFLDKRCFLLIFRDKTYSELIAELENSSKYKSQVLATVSHELRTPVNSTLHLLNSVIESDEVSAPCLENYIKPAKNVLVMMLNLINDILDYTLANQEKLKLVFTPVDVRTVITEALGLLNIQSKKKGIALNLELDPLIPPLYETDPNRLTQVLLNLLSNAYKFTSQGGITVKARMITDDPTLSLLEISVKDTGIGIKDEDLKKLFVGFERIELGDNQKMNPNGCGLGLSIANKIAKYLSREGLGGIRVESHVGKGSNFTFVIENKRRRGMSMPILLQASSLSKFSRMAFQRTQTLTYMDFSLQNIREMKEGEEPVCSKIMKRIFQQKANRDMGRDSVISSNDDGTITDLDEIDDNGNSQDQDERAYKCSLCPAVLIVDDDAFNQLALEGILKKIGYKVKSCFNGEEAVKEVKKRDERGECGILCNQYTAIFMDCQMPIKNGLEATREIKEYFKKEDRIPVPIIGLSAYSLDAGGPAAFEAGMDYYLTKPTGKEKVQEIMQEIEERAV